MFSVCYMCHVWLCVRYQCVYGTFETNSLSFITRQLKALWYANAEVVDYMVCCVFFFLLLFSKSMYFPFRTIPLVVIFKQNCFFFFFFHLFNATNSFYLVFFLKVNTYFTQWRGSVHRVCIQCTWISSNYITTDIEKNI